MSAASDRVITSRGLGGSRPYPEWARATGLGIFGHVCAQRGFIGLDALDAFDRETNPRIRTRAVFDVMIAAGGSEAVAAEAYLAHLATQRRQSTADAAGEPEARAFAAVHFAARGIPSSPCDVRVFRGGTADVLLSFYSANASSPMDCLLVPAGYENALSLISRLNDGMVVGVEDLDTDLREEWIDTNGVDSRLSIYVPLINKFTGKVMTRRRALGIARTVLTYNREHVENPVLVVAEEPPTDGLCSLWSTASMGAITGADLDDASLGCMSDFTLSVVTTELAAGAPAQWITFTTTKNRDLAGALSPWATVYGQAGCSPLDELSAAAALCLTPIPDLHQMAARAAQNLRTLRRNLGRINQAVGFEAVTASARPAADGSAWIRLHPQLRVWPLREALGVLAQLLQPLTRRQTAGVTVNLGSLLSWAREARPGDAGAVLQVNLAAADEDLSALSLVMSRFVTALQDQKERSNSFARSAHN